MNHYILPKDFMGYEAGTVLRDVPLREARAMECNRLTVVGAHPAVSSSQFVSSGINLIVRMALRAVGALCSLRRQPFSAKGVLATSDRLKVGRVAAIPHSTEVVEIHSFGDWPSHFFVGEPMSPLANCSDGMEVPISIGVKAPNPKPAFAKFRLLRWKRPGFVYLLPKPNAHWFWPNKIGMAMLAPSRLVHKAHSYRPNRAYAVINGASLFHRLHNDNRPQPKGVMPNASFCAP